MLLFPKWELVDRHKMNVVAKPALIKFWGGHADAEQSLKTWFSEVQKARWANPQDVKRQFPKASIIANNRVVFNICGNDYRLVVAMDYLRGFCFIKFLGTHSEYDDIDATTVERW